MNDVPIPNPIHNISTVDTTTLARTQVKTLSARRGGGSDKNKSKRIKKTLNFSFTWLASHFLSYEFRIRCRDGCNRKIKKKN